MNNKKRILIVDDSPGDIQFVMENLKNDYAILVATNAQKGIEMAANEPKPDLILMDVMMPEINGYEACKKLKNNSETQEKDRIKEYNNRAIFHFGGASLLIKNMPEDKDFRGRLRDHIIILLEGADNKLASLERAKQLAQIVYEANNALEKIADQQKEHKNNSITLMDNMFTALEESFISWGLDETQEKALLNIVQNSINLALDHQEKGLDIDDNMRDIINRLSQI